MKAHRRESSPEGGSWCPDCGADHQLRGHLGLTANDADCPGVKRPIDDWCGPKVLEKLERMRRAREAGLTKERTEQLCPRCYTVQRDMTADEWLFVRTHSQQDWPQITCSYCGYQGIGTYRHTETY